MNEDVKHIKESIGLSSPFRGQGAGVVYFIGIGGIGMSA